MDPLQKRRLGAVLAAHFVAAFAALGVPPYFGLMLEVSLGERRAWLPGVLYVLPAVVTAVSSPLWGRLADRVGARPMLLRAQLGLAGSFLLAGWAQSTPAFVAALVLQGLAGGTFGASNAVLATFLQGRELRDSLTLMQGSARAALVVAPVVVGLLLPPEAPLRIYHLLCALPLLAGLLTLQVPAGQASRTHGGSAPDVRPPPPLLPHRELFLLQGTFTFATVVTFPYFLPLVERLPGAATRGVAGALFALPHLAYLLAARPLSRLMREHRLAVLALVLAVLAVSILGQVGAAGLAWLVAWRLLMGLAMTAAFVSLHGLVAEAVRGGGAGRTFGRFEASAKWGGVAAGCAAGAASAQWGPAAPLVLGGAAAALAAIHVFCRASAGAVLPGGRHASEEEGHVAHRR